MAKKKVIKDTPIDKTTPKPIKADLEKDIVETTDKLIKEEPVEVEAIVTGVDIALNIRSKPEVKEDNKIAVLKKGTKIIVVDPKKTVKSKDGEWYRIRIVDKDTKDPSSSGYAMKKYIKII